MINHKINESNKEYGITLIALVVTIIVLLILAGVSISMLSGDNGILKNAKDAKQTSERVEAKEQAKMDIMAWITDKTANNQDSSLDDSKVKDILTDKSYVKEAKESSFITAKGDYEIPYSELYIGFKLPDPYIVETEGTWLMDQNELSYFKYQGSYYLITYNQTDGSYESIRKTNETETATLDRLFNIEEGDWILGWVYKNDAWCETYFNDKLLGYELDWYYNDNYRRR